MEKHNLQVLEVTKDGVKMSAMMSFKDAAAYIAKMCADQPLKYITDTPRLYVANVETGEIRKPTLKVEL